MAKPHTRVRFTRRGIIGITLAAAILAAALLITLRPNLLPLESRKETSSQAGPTNTKSHQRETDPENRKSQRKKADPVLVQKWMDELLERHPELKVEIRDVPDHENGHLAWKNFSKDVLENVDFPDCLSDYVNNPNDESRKCAEDWLNKNKNIEQALMKIAALRDQSMQDARMDILSSPVVGEFHNALMIILARGLISAEGGDMTHARAVFASAMNLVRHIDGIESPTLIEHVIGIGARLAINQTFLDRIYPALNDDIVELSLWRNSLAPVDTRDGLSKALASENLRMTNFLISNALSGDFDQIVDARMTDAEIRTLIETGFDISAHAGAAVRNTTDLNTIPVLYAHVGSKDGLNPDGLAFLNEHMETMRGAVTGILKKETRLNMYDAALAAALGETVPVDSVSGKPFLWDEETMTLSAPEGTTPQKPLKLPGKN